MFQFTLPRGERPSGRETKRRRRNVSIHAPAWGATCEHWSKFGLSLSFNSRSRVGSDILLCKERMRVGRVSIHAPAWGATLRKSLARCRRCFNSRSRVGSDLRARPPRGKPSQVSIHAPAWGATIKLERWRKLNGRFNSRSRVGSDKCLGRHPCSFSGFNSRSRVGSDITRHSRGILSQSVSIHAPAWGATDGRACCW